MSILNSNSPIAFFDSGLGGLTVLKQVKSLLPNEDYIFYGDNAHVPYGDKTKEQLLSYANPILKFFKKRGCKAVVMACNTTSSVIYDDIKNNYGFKLYPVVQSVAKILANLDVKRLGVFATKATVESGAYKKEINKYNCNISVFEQYCSQWVNIVENSLSDTPESIKIIEADLSEMMKHNPEKIILGCTHYPYLKPILSKFVPEDMLIDPAPYFAKYIKDDLEKDNLLSGKLSGSEAYYVSSDPGKFKVGARMFYRLNSEPELLAFN